MAIGDVLDASLVEWAARSKWHVRKEATKRYVTFLLSAPLASNAVEIGHANDVHIWIIVNGQWRADSHGDDLESLLFEWEQYLELAEGVIAGAVKVPTISDSEAGQWFVRHLDLYLRRS